MSPGKHYLHVAGRLPSGEMVYSDGVAFFAEQRDGQDFALELKPGIRVEGRLDGKVARPIKNGWVQLSVHDDEADMREERLKRMLSHTSGNTGFWWCYRPIAPDGTFVFESVPRGELKVIAYGAGFISINGEPESAPPSPSGIPPQPPRRASRSVPQSFAGTAPVTAIEVATEATVTLTAVVKAEGKPLRDAKVYVSPNMIQMPNGSRLFAATGASSEAPFRKDVPPPAPGFIVPTDANGIAVIPNVPAFTNTLSIDHPQFELPLRSRNDPRYRDPPRRQVEMTLSPGTSERIELALQPKGREFSGKP
jgi:hypothetical protein